MAAKSNEVETEVVTVNRSAQFDPSCVLTDDEQDVLARRFRSFYANKQYRVKIDPLLEGMVLSDASRWIVWQAKMEAAKLLRAERNEDLLAEFHKNVMDLLRERKESRAKSHIAEALDEFNGDKGAALQILAAWRAEATGRTTSVSDGEEINAAYARAVGVVSTYYGPAIAQ